MFLDWFDGNPVLLSNNLARQSYRYTFVRTHGGFREKIKDIALLLQQTVNGPHVMLSAVYSCCNAVPGGVLRGGAA